jgi:mono/diheme cytochrome c family protein
MGGCVLRIVAAVTAFCAIAPALAQSDAYPFGDPKVGKKVLEAKCSGCHVTRFGGDGSSVFTRQARKASSTQSLLAWVQRCNANAKLELKGEEEESVAAYLNEAYYKFK